MKAILFLHGGGHSDHNRYTKLISHFATEGIIGHAFDHHANLLSGRLVEAELELAKLKKQHSLQDSDIYIWGSSMGGHIACRLTASHSGLAGVILQSAAAYSTFAETIPFGPSFTKELLKDNGWEDSYAFRDINLYKGKVLVIYAEHDNIIPTGIMEKYQTRAKKNGEHHILLGVGHSLLRPTNRRANNAWEQMFIISLDFVLT